MMGWQRGLLIVGIVAAVTLLTRALPFLAFRGRRTPRVVGYLGKVLPVAILAMLVVYSFKGVSFAVYPYGLPELIASAVVVGLHLWKRNTLLSILSGTAVYMLLVQVVFG